MSRFSVLGVGLIIFGGSLSTCLTQDRLPPHDPSTRSLSQRFDVNGDGEIDDQERRAVREKMRQMQNRPGARTPSGETETIGDRLITELQYRSSDGQLIPCVLSMPQGKGPFPVLVTIHGGQGNRDYGYLRSMAAPNGLSPTISAFNEQPWAILAISYRAGNGALFGMEQDDVIAGIRFAKTLPQADSNRIGVVGGSHGGHLALVAAEKMGQEFLCVAVGSPWMTDPVVYMMGDRSKPPLSLVPERAREDLIANGRRILEGMKRSRRMSEPQIREFISEHSIEAGADRIMIPTLFITSRGDDQAPHVLIEPMIESMRAAGKEVQVYTAEKSPHGFYWARTVSAARELRGEKTATEAEEERIARQTIIEFFRRQFAGERGEQSDVPEIGFATADESEPQVSDGDASRPSIEASVSDEPEGRPEAERSRGGQASARISRRSSLSGRSGGMQFESLADATGRISRETFRQKWSGSAAFASRPEMIDRLFDRLDANRDNRLDQSEFAAIDELRQQSGQGGNRNPTRRGSAPAEEAEGSSEPSDESDERLENASPDRAGSSRPSLRLATGELVGERVGGVCVFRGIPYAAAPVGTRRWQPAGTPQAWQGVRRANEFGSPALQGETFTSRSEQSEDCLFLNVWTPVEASVQEKLPVLFWIHGGAFIQGSGAQPRYDGTELARRGVVVVTINYRLGPLGIFAHPALTAESSPDDPLGNYSLLDMIAALRWTRDNISAFGGDPSNVTISGSSAGGTSCLFLMGIPQAHGLFHKAIIHSSGGIQNIQTLAEAEAAGVRLSNYLGLGSNPSATELRRVAAEQVAVNVGVIRELDLPVKPIVDGRLVKAVPAELFAAGEQSRVPVLIGCANGESGARQLGDEVATGGAFAFQRGLADEMARVGQPVWMFQLTYVPPQSRDQRFTAMHGETVAYAFGTIGQSVSAQYGFRNDQVASNAMRSRRGSGNRRSSTRRDDDSLPVENSAQGREISAAMMDYWVSFMRDGKPASENLPSWPSYSPDSPATLIFGNQGISVK